MKPLLLSAVLVIGALAGSLFAQEPAPATTQRATPISPLPEDRSNLPAPRQGVIMAKVVDGRFNVPIGGWGGQRIIQAKTDPDGFRKFVREVKSRGLNCVRPLFHPANAANTHDAEWAKFDWEAMDRVVAITQEEGVYMLVDYHNWLVEDTLHADEATWLKNWGWIVDRYKPYKHLVFEGFNEPQYQCDDLQQHYQKWIDMVRSKGAEQMCVVSPFWGQYFAVNDPGHNWSEARHHYFHAKNSPTTQRAIGEAEHHLRIGTTNKNSAPAAVKQFGCGFFMTEGGVEDKPKTPEERAARIAGVQRMIDICEEQGYGWCLWSHGDWTDGFNSYGSEIKTKADYRTITGEPISAK